MKVDLKDRVVIVTGGAYRQRHVQAVSPIG